MSENQPITIFEIRVPKDNEYTPENAASFLAALVGIGGRSLVSMLLRRSPKAALALEIITVNQRVHFQLAIPSQNAPYGESQILAQYPTSILSETEDTLDRLNQPEASYQTAQLVLSAPFYYPLRTYQDFKDVDPLVSICSFSGGK